MPPATGTNEARPEVAYCPGVKEVPEELVEESQADGDEGSEDGVDEWIQWRRRDAVGETRVVSQGLVQPHSIALHQHKNFQQTFSPKNSK